MCLFYYFFLYIHWLSPFVYITHTRTHTFIRLWQLCAGGELKICLYPQRVHTYETSLKLTFLSSPPTSSVRLHIMYDSHCCRIRNHLIHFIWFLGHSLYTHTHNEFSPYKKKVQTQIYINFLFIFPWNRKHFFDEENRI